MTDVYLNRVATANPPHEAHKEFLRFAEGQLEDRPTHRKLFTRMASRGGIESRYSCFAPSDDLDENLDKAGVYRRGDFPTTGRRMELFAQYGPDLAATAVERLGIEPSEITHLILATCTGFYAPGVDFEVIRRAGLSPNVERTIVGFMGCHAAVNALKLSRHIVRSEPHARVLIINLELCSLHFMETEDLEELLTFSLWGDGCAASLVSADPVGFRLERFHSAIASDTSELMKWQIGDQGFAMTLSGQVPAAVHSVLEAERGAVLANWAVEDIRFWAVHPGGRTVIDAVERALSIDPDLMSASRKVLREYGNMSSSTIMFVMAEFLAEERPGRGCGMAFGPGLVAETFTFSRPETRH